SRTSVPRMPAPVTAELWMVKATEHTAAVPAADWTVISARYSPGSRAAAENVNASRARPPGARGDSGRVSGEAGGPPLGPGVSVAERPVRVASDVRLVTSLARFATSVAV